MTGEAHLPFGEHLRRFLQNPRGCFNPFCQACLVKAYAYLALQKGKGRILPGDDPQDLACDILKYVFLDDKGQHFRKITGYFHNQGIDDFGKADSSELEQLFLPFLYQQLKQGLWREEKWQHPERSARQKTIENNLLFEDFAAVPGHPDCITSQTMIASLRTDAKLLTRELLDRLAWESILVSQKIPDVCREFFRRLHEETEFQNFVNRRELVYALTRAIERLVLEISPLGSVIRTPEDDWKHQAIRLAADRALARLCRVDLARLVKEGTVSQVESSYFAASSRAYLDDLCVGKGTDPMAGYFRVGFPAQYHDSYEKVYKYRFLQVMKLVKQNFPEELDDLL